LSKTKFFMFRHIIPAKFINTQAKLIKLKYSFSKIALQYDANNLKIIQPLLLLCCVIETFFYIILGKNALEIIHYDRIIISILFILIIYVIFVNIILITSFNKIKYYTCPVTKKINLRELWQYCFTQYNRHHLPKFFIIALTPYCITSSANIVWIYQHCATNWHDSVLFELEHQWIKFFLTIYRFVSPVFFDKIYFALWTGLFVTFSLVYTFSTTENLLYISITIIISYMITRIIGLSFPTAGPVFYKPEIFPIFGTQSEFMQNLLKKFMEGKIEQNILFPGTMAMPSLHVGLSFLVMTTLFRLTPYTLILTAPLFILTWLATILLGWHYIIDGIGGIIVMYFSSFFSKFYIWVFSIKKYFTSTL
jgi:membrane-associated phospholipid phosphatase